MSRSVTTPESASLFNYGRTSVKTPPPPDVIALSIMAFYISIVGSLDSRPQIAFKRIRLAA